MGGLATAYEQILERQGESMSRVSPYLLETENYHAEVQRISSYDHSATYKLTQRNLHRSKLKVDYSIQYQRGKAIEERALKREQILLNLLNSGDFSNPLTENSLCTLLAQERRTRAIIVSDITALEQMLMFPPVIDVPVVDSEIEKKDILECYLWHIYRLIEDDKFTEHSAYRRIVQDSAYIIRFLSSADSCVSDRKLFTNTIVSMFSFADSENFCAECGEKLSRHMSHCLNCGERIH